MVKKKRKTNYKLFRLKKADEPWRSLVANAPNYIIIVDRKGIVRFVNRTVQGLKIKDVVGKSITSFQNPKYNKIAKEAVGKAFKGGKMGSYQVAGVGPASSSAWYNINFGPIRKNGKTEAVILIVTDITSQKMAEEKLRESEKKFKNLFESAGEAFFTMDVSEEHGARFLDCNDHTLSLFGCTRRDQIVGKKPEDFSPLVQPDGQPSHAKAMKLAKAVIKGHPQNFEWAHYRLDGTPFWVHVTLNRVTIKNKFFTLAVVHDITERKKAEEALRESEEKHRTVIEGAGASICYFDKKGKLLLFNENVVTDFNTTRKDLEGKTIFDMFSKSQASVLWAKLKRAIKKKEGLRFEEGIRFSSGETKWFFNDIQPVKNSAGEVIGVQVIATDVSDRKQIEAEKEKLISELEAKNAELERFSYTVSHDLKSPLITIRGFAKLLEEDIAKNNVKSIKRDLDYMKNAAIKMQLLLDGVLSLSRIGRIISTFEKVSFGEIIKDVMNMLSGEIQGSNVRIDIDAKLPEIKCDRLRMQQVMQNLIGNAIKFSMKNKEPVVKIGTRSENKKTVFYIKDNGIGIKPQYKDKVFNIFHKLDPNTSGTGIGLTYTKRIIEVHGGHIWIESEGVGKGCTVCFVLPDRAVKKIKNK